ncbi:hypothetical protein HDV06_005900 [Boothiomyces sp. JEL0866]|nr:hypothetical protein HDV06_005900 [Boothiomyces sp. JEL0866]
MLVEIIGISVAGLVLCIIIALEVPNQDIYSVRKSFNAPNIFKIDTLTRVREYPTFEREQIKDYTAVEEQELAEILGKKHVESDSSSVEDNIEFNVSDKSTIYTAQDSDKQSAAGTIEGKHINSHINIAVDDEIVIENISV